MRKRPALISLGFLIFSLSFLFLIIASGAPPREACDKTDLYFDTELPSHIVLPTSLKRGIPIKRDAQASSLSNAFGCNGTRRISFDNSGTIAESRLARLRRWAMNAIILADCSDIKPVATDERVPHIIHRVWECENIPHQYDSALESWVKNSVFSSTDTYVALWTRDARDRLINRLYGSNHLELYQRLIPGAFRADLFRYIVMHHYGGIYSDVDSTLQMGLQEIQYLSAGVTVVIDLDAARLLNGAILMAPPGNPLFLCAMGEVFDHSKRRQTFKSDLDISGPGVLGECLRHVVGRDDAIFDQNFVSEVITLGYRLLRSQLKHDEHVILLQNGSQLLSLQPGGRDYNRSVEARCDPGEHYSVLHRRGEVYRNLS